ncbi:MAG: ABC transporter substrate-binding protein [Firmicutes bacterium]|nr:ABC transporter substrate-binding protein [Bacillota bacterium]
MRRFLILILCALVLAGCAAPAAEEAQTGEMVCFTDDTGASVEVTPKPEKVAVLLSSLADLWVTAGGRVDITVGETVSRGFAGQDAVLVDNGAGKTINLELLIAQKPDLVIYASDLAGQAECADTLRAAGIPTAGFTVNTFDDYLRVLKIATDILDTPEAYEIHGEQVKQRVEKLIATAHSQQTQPSILFVRAGSSAKYTKAKTADTSFVCAMLKELGTVNIAEKAPILLDGLSTEEILLSDPDAIFYTTMGDEASGTGYMESLLADPVWQSMTAVKEGRVYQLPKELFQYKPNARWDEAYEYLIRLLYGEIV